jgi:hypothetical protein
MNSKAFEIQWADFCFLAQCAGVNCHTLRNRMEKAGHLRMLDRGSGRLEITYPTALAERIKVQDKLAPSTHIKNGRQTVTAKAGRLASSARDRQQQESR